MTIVKLDNKEYDLETINTKNLLKLLDIVRRINSQYNHYGIREDNETSYEEVESIIKLELSTREHVPNKQESKELRREKARIAQGKRKI